MEVRIDVEAEDIPSSTITESNSAFFTFVAVDQLGRPIDVPEVEPETAEEKRIVRWRASAETTSSNSCGQNETLGGKRTKIDI